MKIRQWIRFAASRMSARYVAHNRQYYAVSDIHLGMRKRDPDQFGIQQTVDGIQATVDHLAEFARKDPEGFAKYKAEVLKKE